MPPKAKGAARSAPAGELDWTGGDARWTAAGGAPEPGQLRGSAKARREAPTGEVGWEAPTGEGARPAPRRLILVDGPAGAGKTTFAEGLAAGLASPLVHLEDLYLGWSGLESGFARWERAVLAPWLAGQVARFQAYDWEEDAPTGRWVEVAPAATLVVEGCGCAPRAADALSPTIIWLDAPRQRRWDRVLERDGAWEAPFLAAWEADTASHFDREQTAARAHLRLCHGNRAAGPLQDWLAGRPGPPPGTPPGQRPQAPQRPQAQRRPQAGK